jgi:hypothetical protein
MSKRLSIRTDYGAWPIWDVDDFGYIDPAKLPLKQETIDRLNVWQDTFDATLNQVYPPDSKFPSEEAKRNWIQEGIDLWQQVQSELEPQYEVCYNLYYNYKHHLIRHLDDLKQFPGYEFT